MVRQVLSFSLSVALAGCAASTMPPLAPTHPASPEAAEAPVPPPSTTLGQTVSGPRPATAAPKQVHGEDRRVATVYTCPMHPEVRRSKPGQCPKCGMTLVPAGEDDASGTHAH
jgi:hypothetical protein